jgi:hypothetical protein
MATPMAEPSTKADWRPEFLRKLNNRPKAEGAPLRTTGLLVTVNGSSLAEIEAACASQRWNRCLTARYALTGKPAIGTLLHGFAQDLSRLMAGIEPRAKLTARDESAWADYARRAHPHVGALGNDLDSLRQLLQRVSGDPGHREAPLRKGERLVLLAELAEQAVDLDEWELARDELLSQLPERVVVVLADPKGRLRPPDADEDRFEFVDLPAPELAEKHGGQIIYRAGALASDVPAARDALGLDRHFTALARLLLHHETGRLTLAVEGAWGMGKSSFMRFLEDTMVDAALARHANPPFVREAEDQLEKARQAHLRLTEARDASLLAERQVRHDPAQAAKQATERHEATRRLERSAAAVAAADAALRAAKRRAVRDDLVVLHFNPWGYLETGQIWAGLAHRLTSELRDTLTWRERVALRIRYARERKAADLWTAVITVLVAALLAGVAAVEGVEFTSSGNAGILYAGGFVLLGLVFWRAARATKPVVDWLSVRFRPHDHSAGMGYQHEVIQDLRFYADGVRRGREECRMIVFIDDLDRCSDEQILEFMGAINLVLVSSGFYVVLGIDTRMIRDAVRARYGGTEIDPEPGKDIADAYLEKIVQIAYRVPVADAARRYGSVSDLFSPSARSDLGARRAPPGVQSSGEAATTLGVDLDKLQHPGDPVSRPIAEQPVEDTADELQAFIDLQSILPANPRELKRMVNVHRLAKMLLQGEQMAWPPEQQRLLVVWIVVCFRWPIAVRDVLASLPVEPTGGDDVLAAVSARMPVSDKPLVDALSERPTIGEIRNLGLDSVVELCGVLPPKSRDGQPTMAQTTPVTSGAGG